MPLANFTFFQTCDYKIDYGMLWWLQKWFRFFYMKKNIRIRYSFLYNFSIFKNLIALTNRAVRGFWMGSIELFQVSVSFQSSIVFSSPHSGLVYSSFTFYDYSQTARAVLTTTPFDTQHTLTFKSESTKSFWSIITWFSWSNCLLNKLPRIKEMPQMPHSVFPSRQH